MRLPHPLLLLAALLSTTDASACKCDATVTRALYDKPSGAATAFLGKCEQNKEAGKLLRTLASWTADPGAYLLPEKTDCDLRCEPGRVYLVISAGDTKAASSGGFHHCNTIALPAGPEAAPIVAQLEKMATAPHASPNPSWLYCQEDSECVTAPTVCGGLGGVNRKHRAPYLEWVKRIAPTVDCAAPAPQKGPPPQAACVDHLCTIR